MPIFEYRCRDCGRVLETLEFTAADAPTACPHCGGTALERLLSAAAVHTRGDAGMPPLPCGGAGGCCGSDLPRGQKPCMGSH